MWVMSSQRGRVTVRPTVADAHETSPVSAASVRLSAQVIIVASSDERLCFSCPNREYSPFRLWLVCRLIGVVRGAAATATLAPTQKILTFVQ